MLLDLLGGKNFYDEGHHSPYLLTLILFPVKLIYGNVNKNLRIKKIAFIRRASATIVYLEQQFHFSSRRPSFQHD